MNIQTRQSTSPWAVSLSQELGALSAAAARPNPVASAIRIRALTEIAQHLSTDDLVGLASAVATARMDRKAFDS